MKNVKEIFEAGKMTITCAGCSTNWKAYEMPKTCPFCGKGLLIGLTEDD